MKYPNIKEKSLNNKGINKDIMINIPDMIRNFIDLFFSLGVILLISGYKIY